MNDGGGLGTAIEYSKFDSFNDINICIFLLVTVLPLHTATS